MPRLPRVAFVLMIAIVLDTALQIVWKVAASRLPTGLDALDMAVAAARQPWFIAVAALLLAQFFNWIDVLGHADLSFAHAVTALSLVAVAVLATMLFGEPIGWAKGAGIGLVLAGVVLVGTTPHATSGRADHDA